MRLRRSPIFTDLKRPRLGLTENDVRLAQRPRTGQLVLAAATGLAPVIKSAGDGETSRRVTREITPDERAA